MRFDSWTQWDSRREGHARLSEREQARLLSCLNGQAGDSTSTEVGWGAVHVYCTNGFLRDESREAPVS